MSVVVLRRSESHVRIQPGYLAAGFLFGSSAHILYASHIQANQTAERPARARPCLYNKSESCLTYLVPNLVDVIFCPLNSPIYSTHSPTYTPLSLSIYSDLVAHRCSRNRSRTPLCPHRHRPRDPINMHRPCRTVAASDLVQGHYPAGRHRTAFAAGIRGEPGGGGRADVSCSSDGEAPGG